MKKAETSFLLYMDRFITHLVFDRLQQDLDDQEVRVSDEFKGRAKEQTRQTYKELAEIANDSYPDSYLANPVCRFLAE
jgi:hypothetical protein